METPRTLLKQMSGLLTASERRRMMLNTIPLNCNRATFEAFEQRVEGRALCAHLNREEPSEQELADEEAFEALLDYEAGLAVTA